MSTLVVTTPPAPYKLDCRVTPEHGERGTTDFSFNCTTAREAGSLYYEFYDKQSVDNLLFSGIYINHFEST